LPVVLNCPVDIQNGDLVGEFRYQRSSLRIGKTPPMMPDPDEVEKAADMIANARRPVLVAGLGAVTSGAREALDALGDRIGAALATTIRAKGYLDGPWSIGICGNLGSSKVEPFLERADLVIFVGSSVSTNVTGGGSLFPKARTLQIDSDATSIVGGRPADQLLVGDARLAVEAIVQRLVEAEFTAPGYRDAAYQDLFDIDPLAREVEQNRALVAEDEIDPHRLLQELDKFLPRECTLVIGSGHFFAFPCTYLNGYRSRRFLYTYDFGTIGQAIPTGFGVAVADPSRPVVVLEGDASTLMNVHMFDSTAHYEPKMLILVMNDGALGAEFHQLSAKGQDPEWALMPTPDFGRLAEVFGNAGSTLLDATKAEQVISSFVSGTGTHVVDVRISRNVISRHFRRAYFSGDQPHGAQKAR
jgi:acetolactate synthase I/II/III large subunit